MTSPAEQSELIRGIGEAGGYLYKPYEPFTSAAGIEGNFKIGLPEALGRDKKLMQRFVGYMATELAEVDVIVATGGAVDIAAEVAFETGMPLVEYIKRLESGLFHAADALCDDILRKKPRVGIVEDVTSTRFTTEQLARKTSLQGLIDVVVAGWRRGEPAPEGMSLQEIMANNRQFNFRNLYEVPSDLPFKAVIERRIPLWVPLPAQIGTYLPELGEAA